MTDYYYFVRCRICDEYVGRYDTLEDAVHKQWKHYWKGHDNMEGINVEEYELKRILTSDDTDKLFPLGMLDSCKGDPETIH